MGVVYEAFDEELRAAFDESGRGELATVLVSGEAGISRPWGVA